MKYEDIFKIYPHKEDKLIATEELICKYAETLHPKADDLLLLIGYLAKYVNRSDIDRHYGLELINLEVSSDN